MTEGLSKGMEHTDRWRWMMEYCKRKFIPPGQNWAWEEAKKAYEKELDNEGK